MFAYWGFTFIVLVVGLGLACTSAVDYSQEKYNLEKKRYLKSNVRWALFVAATCWAWPLWILFAVVMMFKEIFKVAFSRD